MRNLFIICSFFICYQSFSQGLLGPLTYHPRLYYSTAKSSHHPHRATGHKNLVAVEDSVILIQSDTLSLPFVDDFSYPSLRPYDYSGVYDSILNAVGPCDSVLGVQVVTDSFSLSPTYTYTYDTATKTKDSTPNARIMFLNTDGFTGDCYTMADTLFAYPIGYIDVFDTITGVLAYQIEDSTQVIVPLTYAPVLYLDTAPTNTKWLDNNVYQNYTFGYLPPTLGVVTFDGANSSGQPYVANVDENPAAYGIADILTSKPINLGGLTYGDSVYLSFFYQSGGFGYDANSSDSLVLQFYNGYTSKWDHIWSVAGDTIQPDTPNAFRQVILQLDSTSLSYQIEYLYNGFQFRFLNYGSLTGINDIWNLDYVRLDKNRTFTDTSINDLAFQYQFPSILKNFSEMPAEQFTGDSDLADTVQLYIGNLNPTQAATNPPATSWTTSASEISPSSSVVLAPATGTFNAGPENVVYLYPSSQYTSPTIPPPPPAGFDSVVIHSTAFLVDTDILPANDTIRHTQVLDNVLAYDDGTAELAFGVQNLGTNKFAYDYTLNQPDSLVGFQVLYTTVGQDVHDLVYDFNVWYHLDTQNVFYTDTPIYTSDNLIPQYIDSVNGFTTYSVSPAVPLPTHFYFGWAQTDVRNLQVGYDVNSTKGHSHMYAYTSGVWQKIDLYVDGSVMIRLLLGHSSQVPTGVKKIAANTIKAYPNPTSGMLTFDLPEGGDAYSLTLYNMLGKVCLNQALDNGSNTINIGTLNEGLYLLKLTDNTTGTTYQNKILKSGK